MPAPHSHFPTNCTTASRADICSSPGLRPTSAAHAPAPTSRSSSVPSASSPTLFRSRDYSWSQNLTFDLLVHALYLVFSPFTTLLVLLCLRAHATPYTHPSFIAAFVYAAISNGVHVLSALNTRAADGLPRERALGGEEVVVVAGGGGGLGLVLAQTYGMRGVSVAVLDIRDLVEMERLDELESVKFYQCDVGDRRAVEEAAAKIEKDFGTPTIVINSIATAINGLPLYRLPPEAIIKTINANLMSYFNTFQVFLPGMLSSDNGGTFVTLSSVLGYLHPAGLADYNASKAAVSALHKTVEAELRILGKSNHIKCLLVETGQIETPLFEKIKTPNTFFAPVLEPVKVTQKIVSQIDKGVGGLIRLPVFASLIGWYGILPASIQKLARFLSGIDSAVWITGFAPKPNKKRRSSLESDSDIELVGIDE